MERINFETKRTVPGGGSPLTLRMMRVEWTILARYCKSIIGTVKVTVSRAGRDDQFVLMCVCVSVSRDCDNGDLPLKIVKASLEGSLESFIQSMNFSIFDSVLGKRCEKKRIERYIMINFGCDRLSS